jgi:hypothetical protein
MGTGYKRGERHHRAKLSNADVKEIRRIYLAYVRGYETLARQFQCAPSTIRDIVTYRTRAA